MTRHTLIAISLALAIATTACGRFAEDDARAQAEALTAQAASDAAAIAASTNELVEDALADAGVNQGEVADAVEAAQNVAADTAEQIQADAEAAVAQAQAGILEEGEDTSAGTLTAGVADTPDTVSTAPSTPGVNVNTADLPDAAADLAAELGPITLLQLSLTPLGGYAFQVRDAEMPENVDQYDWQGGEFAEPIPVQLVGGGDLDAAVFSLEGIDLTAPARLAEAALALEIEGGEVDVMNLRMDPFRGLVWSVPVSGTRENKVLFGNLDGTVLEVV